LARTDVDAIHLGQRQKFISVVSTLESAPYVIEKSWHRWRRFHLYFCAWSRIPTSWKAERKNESLDELFQNELNAGQLMRISACAQREACRALELPPRSAMLNFLQRWMELEKLADMLLIAGGHPRLLPHKVPLGMEEAINGKSCYVVAMAIEVR
jgi:hypothetical protein